MSDRVRPVVLPAASTAIAVLDLGRRCDDPGEVCSELIERVGAFLEDARSMAIPVAFTNSRRLRSTPAGELAAGLNRRRDEPVLYPDHFDKFQGGALVRFMAKRGRTSIVLCGSSTNVCVLYTATTAARHHGLDVVIPVDGVNARSRYEHGYALHQLANLPSTNPVRFTRLQDIFWRRQELPAAPAPG